MYYRYVAIREPCVGQLSYLSPEAFLSALQAFESLGAYHDSEYADCAHMSVLRDVFGCVFKPEPLAEWVCGQMPFVHPRLSHVPFRFKQRYILPQPNALTCTLACAWMKMVDVFGPSYFQSDRYVAVFKNERVETHFDIALRCFKNTDTESYQVVVKHYTSLGDLKQLLCQYGSAAIGIFLSPDIQHWVIVDAVQKIKIYKNTDKKEVKMVYYSLSVRDPVRCLPGRVCVGVDSHMFLLTPQKKASSAFLLGDFITIAKQPAV